MSRLRDSPLFRNVLAGVGTFGSNHLMGCVTRNCWRRIRSALAAVDSLAARRQCKHNSTHEYNAGSETDTADRHTHGDCLTLGHDDLLSSYAHQKAGLASP